jgi:hypothetical protein
VSRERGSETAAERRDGVCGLERSIRGKDSYVPGHARGGSGVRNAELRTTEVAERPKKSGDEHGFGECGFF